MRLLAKRESNLRALHSAASREFVWMRRCRKIANALKVKALSPTEFVPICYSTRHQNSQLSHLSIVVPDSQFLWDLWPTMFWRLCSGRNITLCCSATWVRRSVACVLRDCLGLVCVYIYIYISIFFLCVCDFSRIQVIGQDRAPWGCTCGGTDSTEDWQ